MTGKIVANNNNNIIIKKCKHTHYTLYGEKNEYVQFSDFLTVDVVLVNVGRRNLGGLSNAGKDLSRGQQLLIDWIDCFPIFVLVRRL